MKKEVFLISDSGVSIYGSILDLEKAQLYGNISLREAAGGECDDDEEKYLEVSSDDSLNYKPDGKDLHFSIYPELTGTTVKNKDKRIEVSYANSDIFVSEVVNISSAEAPVLLAIFVRNLPVLRTQLLTWNLNKYRF